MPRIRDFSILLTALLAALPVAAQDGQDADRNWPQWRGPLGTGVAPHADPPVEWSESRNIRWKIVLPGRGHSTPVVWGDRLFLTAAVPQGGGAAAEIQRCPWRA